MLHESELVSSRDLLLPWRRAESLRDALVLWAPCGFREMPESQHAWLSLFFERWFAVLATEHALSEEHFMQMETLQKEQKLSDQFYSNLMRDRPLMGRSISSLREPPRNAMTKEDVDLLVKNKVKYDYHAVTVPRACWFRGTDTVAIRATYFGFGGMTILLAPRPEENSEEDQEKVKQLGQLMSRLRLPAFMRKDPRMVALVEGIDPQKPLDRPAFIRNHPGMAHFNATFGSQKADAQKMMKKVMFGRKMKEIFGDSLKNEHTYENIPFALPRFSSAEILGATADDRALWLQLFDVYIRESPEDEGILLLAKRELLPGIVETVASLRKDGYAYWER